MRALLTLRDELQGGTVTSQRRAELQETLRTWVLLAEEKLAALRAQMAVAEAFVSGLNSDVARAMQTDEG
jgi:hypothetical protein